MHLDNASRVVAQRGVGASLQSCLPSSINHSQILDRRQLRSPGSSGATRQNFQAETRLEMRQLNKVGTRDETAVFVLLTSIGITEGLSL